MPLVEVVGQVGGGWGHVGIKVHIRIQVVILLCEVFRFHQHYIKQLLEDGFGDLGRKRSEAVLLAPQEDVREALALALTSLQLCHADFRRLVCTAGLFADSPAHFDETELEAALTGILVQVRHNVGDQEVALALGVGEG